MTVLDDRGWNEYGPPDKWERTSVDEIEAVPSIGWTGHREPLSTRP